MLKYRYTLVFSITILLGALIFSQVLFSSLPFNPTRATINLQKTIFSVLPQGWAFFTRSPREAQVILYSITDTGLELVSHRHSSHENFFGLSRRSTTILSELQYFKETIADNHYIDTEWNYQCHIYGIIPDNEVSVKNIFKNPLLCGRYLLVLQEQVPWAWLNSMENIKMPAKALSINIKCQD